MGKLTMTNNRPAATMTCQTTVFNPDGKTPDASARYTITINFYPCCSTTSIAKVQLPNLPCGGGSLNVSFTVTVPAGTCDFSFAATAVDGALSGVVSGSIPVTQDPSVTAFTQNLPNITLS
jgi:hypothetical protein